MNASLPPLLDFTALAADVADPPPAHRHRTIWLSDVHLGTPGCKAAFLLDFLKWNDAETMYLVGDIVDGWRLRKGWHWPAAHNDIVQKLLRKARKGTQVVYVPGNHDAFARGYIGNAFGGEANGRLRVNAPLTFGNLHLAPLWPRFLTRHPKVALDVTLNDRLVDLVDEGYDVAIRITTRLDPQLVSRRLATSRMVLCASPGYLAAHGAPAHPRELAGHAVFAYSYWATGDDWTFAGPEGPVTVRVAPRMHTNSGDTCRVAALEDQGIVLQPDFVIGPDLARGTLVELMPDFRSIQLGIHAVYATRKHLPAKTRALIDFLVEAFASPAWGGPRQQAAPASV